MRYRKFKLSLEHQLEIKKTNVQKEQAERELTEAKSLAKELRQIREENHFSHDFRKAIGGT